MRLTATLLCAFVLSACQSASTIMAGYVGKPIMDPVLDYGMPANAFDISPNHRAFQWRMTTSYTAPVKINIKSSRYGDWVSSNSTITGGQQVSGTCLYTLTAVWQSDTWIVDGYRKPRSACE